MKTIQKAIYFLVAVTVYFTQKSYSLPTNKYELSVLKKECNKHCSAESCFIPFSEKCYHYIRCVKTASEQEYSMAYLMTCPLGQVWMKSYFTCLPIERSGNECIDECSKDKTLTAYHHGSFCAQYYVCVNGTSEPRCCRDGEAFNGTHCAPSKDCIWECPAAYAPIETTTASNENMTTSLAPETTTVCTSSAVVGKPMEYRMNDVTLLCPRGTVFNESKCGCDFDPTYIPSTECFPEIEINYDAEKVSRNDAQHDTEVRKVTGGGKFNSRDRSSTKVDHYNGNGNLLRHFNMTIVFKSESTEGRRQYLITNCRSTETYQPSIGIMVSNIDGMLLFVADDNATAPPESSIKMTLEFKQGAWNWVRYIFDGRTLKAKVVPLPDYMADPSTVTEFYSKNVTLAAPSEDPVILLPSQNPLTIGYCNNHGYDGIVYMADLAPWVCSMYMDSLNGL